MYQMPDAEKSAFRVGQAQVQMLSVCGTLSDVVSPSRRTSVKMLVPFPLQQPADQRSPREKLLDGWPQDEKEYISPFLA